jgi:hypothetical protein
MFLFETRMMERVEGSNINNMHYCVYCYDLGTSFALNMHLVMRFSIRQSIKKMGLEGPLKYKKGRKS